MATFSAQVVDLVGTFSDETALDSFITEGANEVINAMPRSMQERVAEETFLQILPLLKVVRYSMY